MQYIPNQQQRIKIYDQLQSQHNKENSCPNTLQFANSQQSTKNKLTKQQAMQLVNRLTKNTKKQYELKHHIDNLVEINTTKNNKEKRKNKAEERLIAAGKRISEKKENLKQRYLEQEQKLMQKMPTISKKSKYSQNIEPFYDRIGLFNEHKDKMNADLAAKYLPKFKPSLDPHSLFIAEVNHGSKNLIDRNKQFEEKKAQKLENLRDQLLQQQVDNFTSKPQLNKKSISMIRIREQSIQVHNKHRKRALQQPNYSFKPQINHKSQMIIKKKIPQNVSSRLYQQAIKRGLKNKMIQMNKNKQRKQPQMNKKSKKILEEKQLLKKKLIQSQLEIDEQYEEIMVHQEFECSQLFDDGPFEESEEAHFTRESKTVKNSRRTSIH